MTRLLAFAAGIAAGVYLARWGLQLPAVEKFISDHILRAEPAEDNAFGDPDVNVLRDPPGEPEMFSTKQDETVF